MDTLPRLASAAAALLLLAASPGAAQRPAPPAPAGRALAWHWAGPVPAGATVRVHLVRGRVRVERAPGVRMELRAERQGRASDPATVELVVERDGAGLRVRDLYPRALPVRVSCLPPDTDGRGDFWHSDVRTRMVVRVPAGVRVEVRLMSGDIELDGVGAEVGGVTHDGRILRGAKGLEHETGDRATP